jgi:hypothetical protein
MTSAVVKNPSAASQNVPHIMTRDVGSIIHPRDGSQTGEQNSWEVTNPSLATSMVVAQGLYFHMIELLHVIASWQECALENMSIP